MRKRSPNGLLLFVLVARSKGELPARASAPAQIAGWRLRGGSAVSPLARSILAAPTNLFAVAQANVQLRNPGGFNFANIYFAFGTAGETSTNHALPWQLHCWAELQPAGGSSFRCPTKSLRLRPRACPWCVCVCHTHTPCVCVCVFVLRAPFHKGWMQGTSKVKPLLWMGVCGFLSSRAGTKLYHSAGRPCRGKCAARPGRPGTPEGRGLRRGSIAPV